MYLMITAIMMENKNGIIPIMVCVSDGTLEPLMKLFMIFVITKVPIQPKNWVVKAATNLPHGLLRLVKSDLTIMLIEIIKNDAFVKIAT